MLNHGYASLFQYVSGFYVTPTIHLVGGGLLQPRGLIAGGKVITNPSEIVTALRNVTINGVSYELIPATTGAYVDFSIILGSDKLVIDFGNRRGLFADIDVEGDVIVLANFTHKPDISAYTASFHYDWTDTMIKIDRIELLDMPKPALLIERKFEYRYGELSNLVFLNSTHPYCQKMVEWLKDTTMFSQWQRIGNMFELNVTTAEGRYSYATIENTLWIDPANGGIMQPCKSYTFNYFYGIPPDAWVKIYFNGTNVVGTQPQHISIKVGSNVEQDVTVVYRISLNILNYTTHLWQVVKEWTGTETVHISPANRNYTFVILDAPTYLNEALKYAKQGYPVNVMCRAEIVEVSKSNFITTNDFDEKPLPILLSLTPYVGSPCTLDILIYDAYNQSPIQGASVFVYFEENGTLYKSLTTNASGWASVNITQGIAYKVIANATDYFDPTNGVGMMVLILNKTYSTLRYPLVPYETGISVIPPQSPDFLGNWTHPPYPVQYPNGTIYWSLAIQVIYNDSYPVEGADITIYDQLGNIIAQGKTNGTGFVYFWIKNNTIIDVKCSVTVDTTSYVLWQNNTLVDRSLWIVFTLPVQSLLYTPEVGIMELSIEIHRGQGYYFGNVSHLIYAVLWTNKPQTVTVNYTIYDWDTNTTVIQFSKSYDLLLGINVVYEWININASKGMHIRVFAEIVQYTDDTDAMNNKMWSNIVYLKPFADFYVFVVWRPILQKTPLAILPEDVIEIDVQLYVPINTTDIPAKLSWRFEHYNLTRRAVEVFEERVEDIYSRVRGRVWRNMTVVVPWSDKLIVYVNVTHEFDDIGANNMLNFTIDIDPDILLEKIEPVSITGYLRSGSKFRIKCWVKSNVPKELEAMLFLNVYANVTEENIGKKYLIIEPQVETEVEATVPENPALISFGGQPIIRYPIYTHPITVIATGYDLYAGNNMKSFEAKVYSTSLLYLVVGVIGFIVVLAIVVAIVRAIVKVAYEHKRKYWVRTHHTTILAEKVHMKRKKYWEKE